MKIRTTVILFGIFLILLVFVYLFEGPLSEKEQKKQEGVVYLFPGFQKENAVKISVTGPSQGIILERQMSHVKFFNFGVSGTKNLKKKIDKRHLSL